MRHSARSPFPRRLELGRGSPRRRLPSSRWGRCSGYVTVVGCSPDPQRLALGPSEVYWLDWDAGTEPPTGTILCASKDGGVARPLGTARDSLAILRTDGQDLFWTDHRDDYKDGVLRKATIAEGDETTLIEGVYLASALALDEANVYFGTVAEVEVDGIARIRKSGGLPEVLLDGSLVGDMTVRNGELYWLEVRSEPSELGLPVRRTSVYRAMPDNVMARTLLAEEDRDDPVALVATEEFVFWTFGLFGELWRVGHDATGAISLAAGGADTWALGVTLDTDGSNLYFNRYWYTSVGGDDRSALVRSSLDGTDVVELTRAASIVDQAVDDEFVYFTGSIDSADSRVSGIFRRPK